MGIYTNGNWHFRLGPSCESARRLELVCDTKSLHDILVISHPIRIWEAKMLHAECYAALQLDSPINLPDGLHADSSLL